MKKPLLDFLTSRLTRDNFRRYRMPFAIMLVLTSSWSNLGTRLGLWSTPVKSGLLPYEAPTFHVIRELFISEAFAS